MGHAVHGLRRRRDHGERGGGLEEERSPQVDCTVLARFIGFGGELADLG